MEAALVKASFLVREAEENEIADVPPLCGSTARGCHSGRARPQGKHTEGDISLKLFSLHRWNSHLTSMGQIWEAGK